MNLIVDITISAAEYLKHYQVPNAQVSTHSRDGRSVTFPANILQPFVLHEGVRGSFQITVDSQGKFKAIVRL